MANNKKCLIIVESPSKAPTIEKYLKGDAVVKATKGHVRDLPQRSLGIDIDHDFAPLYQISPDKKKIVDDLKAEINSGKYSKVYLATDPDREGESISWHLKEVLGINDPDCRIEFNEITENVIRHALDHSRAINMDLVNSQQARRLLDRLVGYKISPILSKKLKPNLSAGRVQSAALKMIVDREKEIDSFVPEEYWNISASLTKDLTKKTKTNTFKANLQDRNGKKIKVENGTQAKEITSLMQGANYVVDHIDSQVKKVFPQPPFTTSTMQQEASHKLNMTAEQTSRAAQQLYEGVKLANGELIALVTYIRTDSVRTSPDFQALTLNYLRKEFGSDYVPAKGNQYKTSDAAQDAHEAIRPTHLDRTPESLKDQLPAQLYKLYTLIYERYLASQMTPALYNTMNVHIACDCDNGEKLGFSVKGKAVKFPGFTKVYSATEEKKDDEDEEMKTLPNLTENEKLYLEKIMSDQKFTKPPQRYNDATLVKAMEENGIGRPSTYASIISVIAKREYTAKKGKSIYPTDLGKEVCDYMENNFKDIMDLTFTARMEGALDKIAEGNTTWLDLVSKYYPHLKKQVEKAQGTVTPKQAGIQSNIPCEKCGAMMVIKEGKFGQFLACPNYPKCRNIKKIIEPIGVCPKCGGGLLKKTSKTGKVFYGCANYPKCDFVTWDTPAPKLCPTCGSFMKSVEKEDGTIYVCTNRLCKHVERPKED